MYLRKREAWILAGALFLLLVLFGWRQFYGFNKNDELFYISTVYRFFQGDAMLVDEWNNCQLFAFVTYPLFCLFRLFRGTNEGVVLVFRMFYLAFQAAVSVYCFRRLSRFGAARLLPAIYYFVTTPYNINGLSYNTLALGFVLLVLATVAGEPDLRPGDAVLCGIFTAGAVLANPYAVLLFFLYGCICAGYSLYGLKKGRDVDPALRFRSFFWMGAGAAFVLVLFLFFVFSRGSLSEILESVSYIVMDSERQKSFGEKLAKYFIRIHRYYPWLLYTTGASLALWFGGRKKGPAWLHLLAVSAVAAGYIVYYGFFWEMVGVNYMLIPLAFPGLTAYAVTKRRDRRLFYGWYLPGLLFTLVAHFASNTGILAVSAAYMVASAASLLLIVQAMRELGGSGCLKIVVMALFAVQLLACVWQRVTFVWGDASLGELTCRIPEGPLKGIRTTAENLELYEDVMRDMEELRLTKEDKLFVVGIAPWMYLNTEAECASHSTWETLETDPLILTYYELRPHKLPTVVYFYEYDESVLETELANAFLDMGYEADRARRGIVLQCR